MREIRSFVRREGRNSNYKKVLADLWGEYGIDVFDGKTIDILDPTVLEIGFGEGASLFETAQSNPDINYIGVEVYETGVTKLLKKIKENNLQNIKVIKTDAMLVLDKYIPKNSLQKVQLFFPDPWPKARHHKRRIVRPEFVKKIADVLKPGGSFHMATDWENYAEHMLEVMENSQNFTNSYGVGNYAPNNLRPLTKFENRGKNLGHKIFDLVYNINK